LPTIEIISLGRKNIIRIERRRYNFAIRQNSKLISHRGLFKDFLSKNEGVILHIGNLELKNECFFFASELIDWDSEGNKQIKGFRFKKSYILGIKDLLNKSITLSPIKQACFLSDIQTGPELAQIISLKNIDEFWNLHNYKGLAWNTMYIIQDQVT
jgi:hypothetical protein